MLDGELEIFRARELRRRSRDSILAFAEAQERLAKLYAEAAWLLPASGVLYDRLAEQALRGARRARAASHAGSEAGQPDEAGPVASRPGHPRERNRAGHP